MSYMKKIILLILMLFLLSGCTPISEKNLNMIVEEATKSETKLYNQVRNGYKFYIPRGIKIVRYDDLNEKLTDNVQDYYLYVDLVSFYNKIHKEYEKNNNAYYSTAIKNGDKFGYLEINRHKNGKYLIEIMYNYAKIEVMVEEGNLKIALSRAISILATVNYSDKVLQNMMGDNVLQFKEVEFDIFETRRNGDNYLYYEEKEVPVETVIPDTDLIN